MRLAPRFDWRANPSFSDIHLARRRMVLHRDLLPHADTLIRRLQGLAAGDEAGMGNRRGAFHVRIDRAPEIFARRSRRGGMIASLLDDVYFGLNPRPLQELSTTLEAARRGIAVADPLGAVVDWIAPALYRGWFLTRAIAGMTLWEFLQTDDDPTVRAHVLAQARDAIQKMHNCGLLHADLNLHNLMVTKIGESFAVIILDLDKSRLYDTPLSPSMRHANAMRLLRSARKLDPDGRFVDSAALKILNLA